MCSSLSGNCVVRKSRGAEEQRSRGRGRFDADMISVGVKVGRGRVWEGTAGFRGDLERTAQQAHNGLWSKSLKASQGAVKIHTRSKFGKSSKMNEKRERERERSKYRLRCRRLQPKSKRTDLVYSKQEAALEVDLFP
jgi:hypothetical protein